MVVGVVDRVCMGKARMSVVCAGNTVLERNRVSLANLCADTQDDGDESPGPVRGCRAGGVV